MADLPIACSLDPESLAARREGLLAQLVSVATHQEELSDGRRLRFAPAGETLALIARAIEAERRCCRFLRFTLTVEPGGGPILLDLTGPPGTREFVGDLLAPRSDES